MITIPDVFDGHHGEVGIPELGQETTQRALVGVVSRWERLGKLFHLHSSLPGAPVV